MRQAEYETSRAGGESERRPARDVPPKTVKHGGKRRRAQGLSKGNPRRLSSPDGSASAGKTAGRGKDSQGKVVAAMDKESARREDGEAMEKESAQREEGAAMENQAVEQEAIKLAENAEAFKLAETREDTSTNVVDLLIENGEAIAALAVEENSGVRSNLISLTSGFILP